MVSQFPLDYMHLVCLGVVRKLILMWIKGPLKIRLPNKDVKVISTMLKNCIPKITSDFNRTPRDIELCERWKATEARQFLLYTGPVVLKNVLQRSVYDNFLLLSVAIRILISNDREKYDIANELLIAFVGHCQKLYGPEGQVYNFHNLIHLTPYCKIHGSLDNFSAFPMENYLGTVKRMIRCKHHPLQQVHRRISERVVAIDLEFQNIFNQSSQENLKEINNSKKVQIRNFYLKTAEPDCYFIGPNGFFKYDLTLVKAQQDVFLETSNLESDDSIESAIRKSSRKVTQGHHLKAVPSSDNDSGTLPSAPYLSTLATEVTCNPSGQQELKSDEDHIQNISTVLLEVHSQAGDTIEVVQETLGQAKTAVVSGMW
ncbi:unnamed protein product [Allacma fusca]|uniref:DUF4218 domain-containing protein n=1 Tax=Allacma fusca TaxID=39272 RepID=A0A8J2LKC3_9HEXA|nr:unnamed protein product [Allacma fusca]